MSDRPTSSLEVMILEPTVFSDERGAFFESYNAVAFNEATGFAGEFVQDNQSRSVRGVVRALHYQLPPHAQGKLVRCVDGEVFDVAVDLRRSLPSFGSWTAEVLTADNRLQLWVPPGFAHGFMALSETADVLYKTTSFYAPDAERTIRWDDPAIGIEWPDIGSEPILSGRDAAAPTLDHAEVFS